MSESILEIINRWEPLGLLEGLPITEKEELAQLYDTITRMYLSKISDKTLSNESVETISDVMYPTLRRLYRRVGLNINLDTVLSKLIKEVNNNIDAILKPVTKDKNPIVEFCINFADTYEDELTNINSLSDEDYSNKVDEILIKLREILLNKNIISYIEKTSKDGWVLKKSETIKSGTQTRFWNQQKAIDFLKITISETNKNNE
jgi:hypothetical protein